MTIVPDKPPVRENREKRYGGGHVGAVLLAAMGAVLVGKGIAGL